MNVGLETLRERSLLSLLDCEFAERLGVLAGETRPLVLLAAALTRREAAEGHICLDLGAGKDEGVFAERFAEFEVSSRPDPAELREALSGSSLVEVPDAVSNTEGDRARPLVLDASGRVYLRRYWSYQTRLAEQLRRRGLAPLDGVDEGLLIEGLDRYFPPSGEATPQREEQTSFDFMQAGNAEAHPSELDRQRLAAAVAMTRRLTVISGGPGTGKTATVVKILALAIEQARASGDESPLRVRLVAPTGKAAATLAAAIRRGAKSLELDDAVRDALPLEAVTIHRCLGVRSGARSGVRYDANSPLPVDLLVVDEASMVDLALMTRLFEAVPKEGRIILLGDEHQLASVEAGAVLGDVCRSTLPEGYGEEFAEMLGRLTRSVLPVAESGVGDPPRSALRNNVVRLTRSYRYASDRGIGALAAAINAGNPEAVLGILDDPEQSEVVRRGYIHDTREAHDAFRAEAIEGFTPYLREEDPIRMFEAFGAYRVLTPVRAGRAGVEGLNREIELLLRRAGVWDGAAGDPVGRPLLVSENDHPQGLFNGDIGFFVAPRDDRRGRPDVAFIGAENEVRRLSPARIPAHEPAFAMTIHKSQGSEFDRVAVVISDAAAEHATRQQLYTAITRARQQVTLYASADAIAQAVERDTKRSSGLGDALCAELPAR